VWIGWLAAERGSRPLWSGGDGLEVVANPGRDWEVAVISSPARGIFANTWACHR